MTWFRRAKVVKYCREGHVMALTWRTCPRCTQHPAEIMGARDELEATRFERPPEPARGNPELPEGCVACLRAEAGPIQGRLVPLVPGRLRVGKKPSEQTDSIALTIADDYLSREHASFEIGPAAIVLRDLGSTNGTFVNGRRVERALLQRGDVVQIGETLLRVASAEEA